MKKHTQTTNTVDDNIILVRSLITYPFSQTKTTQQVLNMNLSWGRVLGVSLMLMVISTVLDMVGVMFGTGEIAHIARSVTEITPYMFVAEMGISFVAGLVSVVIIYFIVKKLAKAQGTLLETYTVFTWTGVLIVFMSCVSMVMLFIPGQMGMIITGITAGIMGLIVLGWMLISLQKSLRVVWQIKDTPIALSVIVGGLLFYGMIAFVAPQLYSPDQVQSYDNSNKDFVGDIEF